MGMLPLRLAHTVVARTINSILAITSSRLTRARVFRRVQFGSGKGCLFGTRAKPVPVARVAGYPGPFL